MRRQRTPCPKEGKDPPLCEQRGDGVTLTVVARPLSVPFRTFVAEEAERGHLLQVDQLLILHHLLRHPAIDTVAAARVTQLAESRAREILAGRIGLYLETSGEGGETCYALRPELQRRLPAPSYPERDRRGEWEAAKAKVLSVLKQRAQRGEVGLANRDVRQITRLDRNQLARLMRELMKEHRQIHALGKGRNARYSYRA